MNELASSMESTYSTAKICNHGEDLSSCEPSLSLGGKSSFDKLSKFASRIISILSKPYY